MIALANAALMFLAAMVLLAGWIVFWCLGATKKKPLRLRDRCETTEFTQEIKQSSQRVRQIALTATQARISRALRIADALEELRVQEGDLVTILCDNPDFGGPNMAIECNGDWTGWTHERYEGEDVPTCLEAAVADRRKRVVKATQTAETTG